MCDKYNLLMIELLNLILLGHPVWLDINLSKSLRPEGIFSMSSHYYGHPVIPEAIFFNVQVIIMDTIIFSCVMPQGVVQWRHLRHHEYIWVYERPLHKDVGDMARCATHTSTCCVVSAWAGQIFMGQQPEHHHLRYINI